MENKIQIKQTHDEINFIYNTNHVRIFSSQEKLYYSIGVGNDNLTHCTSALLFQDGKKVQPIFPKITKKDEVFNAHEEFSDTLGRGLKLSLLVSFGPYREKMISGKLIFKIYTQIKGNIGSALQNFPYISVQIQLKNAPKELRSANLYGYAPLYMKDMGKINLQGSEPTHSPKDITFYSNGYQSWSLNHLYGYKDKFRSCISKIGRINMENQDYLLDGRYQSEYHSVISNKKNQHSVILSFLTLQDQFSRVLMDRIGYDCRINWLCAYSQTDGIALKKLNEGLEQSEVLMISLTNKPVAYEVLRNHSKFAGEMANIKLDPHVLAGWCSWYYYYTKIDEGNMLKNLNYFEKHEDIPIDLIQLDDGYQTCISDWGIDEPYTFNDKFPQGLPWLVDKIHDAKFKSGLWVAPFFTTKEANLFQTHKNWPLKNTKGKYVKTSFNWGAFQYGLDTSKNEVQKYLYDLSNTIGDKWDFDFLKIDFLFASSAKKAVYKGKTLSRAQAIYQGVKKIREGLGSQRTLLGCGAPLGPCVGLVDVMRIGCDTSALWGIFEGFTRKYLNLVIPALKPALLATIQRSYMHYTLWINDPDCVVVRRNRSKLSLDEIKLQLTVFGLSGGQILISDDETKVEQDRISLLKRILPANSPKHAKRENLNNESKDKKESTKKESTKKDSKKVPEGNSNRILPMAMEEKFYSAVPLDLFTERLPTIYSKTIEIGEKTHFLTAVINWDRKARSRTIQLRDLCQYKEIEGFSNDQQFFVFDYWEENALGFYTLDNFIHLEDIPKHGCRYLNIVPLDGYRPDSDNKTPLFIASNHHILQGLVEIKELIKGKSKLEIMVGLPGKRTGSFYFLIGNSQKVSGIIKDHDSTEKGDQKKPSSKLQVSYIEKDIYKLAKINFEMKERQKLVIKF